MAESRGCALEGVGPQSYGLRIGALFGILAVSAIGCSLPWICKTVKLQSAFFFGTCFAGGVVLATGFVHILPEAAEDLSNACLGLSTEFPWAYVFCGTSVMLTFMGEYFLRLLIRRQFNLSEDPQLAFQHDHYTVSDAELGSVKADGSLLSDDDKMQQAIAADNRVAAIMLEAGIIFHSIFVGLTVGINSEASEVRPLMIAIMFHQAIEGLALGTTLIRANFSTLKYLIYMLAFVLVTPVGVAIGIGVSTTYNENGKLELGIEGAFNALSAGILVYNGLVDLLLPAFTSSGILVGRRYSQAFAMSCMFAGFACMSLLAKWA